jgi:hypothetical protein
MAGIGVLVATPAHAGDSYTITAAGNGQGAGALDLLMQASKCSPTVINSQANGLDARVLPAAPYRGRRVKFTWTAAASSPTSSGSVGQVFSFDAGCSSTNLGRTTDAPGRNWYVDIPPSAEWLVVHGDQAVSIVFTVTPL